MMTETVTVPTNLPADKVRTYALELALHYANEATRHVDHDGGPLTSRAHVQTLAQVSVAWSTLAEALRP